MMLNDLTMTQFEEALHRCPVAVLPMGSVEEHGEHLPLGTDTLQVEEVARRACLRTGALLCPSVSYGYCRSTRDHPGTLSISPETVRRLVFDIGTSLHRQGVRGLLVVSGHAGGLHMAALEEAAESLVERHENLEVAVVCEYRWAQEAGKGGLVETPDDGHAGEIETSRILAVSPELVRGRSPEEYPRFERPFVPRSKRLQWPGGVWGDPSKATADKGERLLRACADRMVELLQELERRVERDGER